MPQIRLERVSKYYPQDKKQMAAVQEINLTVEQGEFLFLTGSSGAGKSTLVRCINFLEQPTKGRVVVDGYQPDAAFQASPRPSAPGFRPRTSALTAHAETDHLRKFIRSRHADAEPEAPAYTNPDSEDFGYGRPA